MDFFVFNLKQEKCEISHFRQEILEEAYILINKVTFIFEGFCNCFVYLLLPLSFII